MPHLHLVVDDDRRFVIDPTTRTISNKAGSRTTIIQFDHNSEELTFEFPKTIEGHDMTQCDVVQVHFANIGTGTSVSNRAINSGIYEMTNMAESPEDPNTLTCSWLISQTATQNYGTIEFSLKFICYDDTETGIPGYIWNTDICKSIDVKRSLDNGDYILKNYPDLYHQLEKRLFTLEKTGIPAADAKAAIENYFAEDPPATIDEVNTAIGNYMAENPPVDIDGTLTIRGAAADAMATGKKLSALDSKTGDLSALETSVKKDLVSAINDAYRTGAMWNTVWLVPYSYPTLTTFDTPNVGNDGASGNFYSLNFDLPKKIDFGKNLYEFEVSVYGLQRYGDTGSSTINAEINFVDESGSEVEFITLYTTTPSAEEHLGFPRFYRETVETMPTGGIYTIGQGWRQGKKLSGLYQSLRADDMFGDSVYKKICIKFQVGPTSNREPVETFGICLRYRISDGEETRGSSSISPIVELSRDDTAKCVNVTVTDAEGVKTTQIYDGSSGVDGKSAYRYAQEGGYKGTEDEFAAKLATESIPVPAAGDRTKFLRGDGTWAFPNSVSEVIEFSIPQNAWVIDESASGRCTYFSDVSHETISVSHLPDVTLSENSLEIAYECGMVPVVDVLEDGKIRFYAQSIPTDAISGTCSLWPVGGSGEDYVDDESIATDDEVNEMLETVFGK